MYSPLKNKPAEQKVFQTRAWIGFGLIVLGLFAIMCRYAYLQVWKHDYYTTASDKNRIKLQATPPQRGYIYDRNGVLLADNKPEFSAIMSRENTPHATEIIEKLTPIFSLTDEDKIRIMKDVKAKSSHLKPITLKNGLTDVEIARFSEVKYNFKGISIQTKMTRIYPYGEMFAHVLGYVARINDKDEQEINPELYAGTDLIGKSGIEKTYENILLGKPGYLSYEADANGKVIRKLGETDSIHGTDLYLSLDYGLQKIAVDQLAGRRGAVVAIDPSTGEVMAFVSNPSFNPNLFVSGISSKEYRALTENIDQPLYNRALQGVYPPGSTIKPFAALGGLHYGLIDWNFKISDPGFFSLPGDSHRFRDWKKSGHGIVDINKAIAMSCDTFFYQLANRMGVDRFHDWMSQFGFGAKTGIDLPYEKTGTLPSSAWKLAKLHKPWFQGETMSVGIGQGYFTATPLQVALATAITANQGHRVIPHLVHKVHNTSEIPIKNVTNKDVVYNGSIEDWTLMRKAMEGVVQHGTAGNLKRGLVGYSIAGKTGTAQVKSIAQGKKYNEALLTKYQYDHAWFIGFAPADAPKLAVAVLVENGKHGNSTAGPIAKALLDYVVHRMNQNPIRPNTLMVTDNPEATPLADTEGVTTPKIKIPEVTKPIDQTILPVPQIQYSFNPDLPVMHLSSSPLEASKP